METISPTECSSVTGSAIRPTAEPSIRILEDGTYLAEAQKWVNEAPKWFQELSRLHMEPMGSGNNELQIGVFAPELCAVVRLILCPNGYYDVHLYVKRRTDPEMLFAACQSILSYLFDNGIRGLSGWVPKMHTSIVNLYENLGFRHSGVRSFEGVLRDRVIEWLYFEKP